MSSGWSLSGARQDNIYSVEAFEFFENKLTFYQTWLKKKHFHATGSFDNKMINGDQTLNCEVFDGYSKKLH